MSIAADGRYAVNGQTLESHDPATLKAALQAATGGRVLPLIISADGRTPHQAVATALDVAGQLGIRQLSIATVNAATPEP